MKLKVLFLISLFFICHSKITEASVLESATANDSIDLNISPEKITGYLSELPDTSRLHYLNKLAQKRINSPKQIEFTHLLREEALRQENDEYYARSLFLLAMHYYEDNADSMRYWAQIAEPLFLELNRYEEITQMKSWNIYALTREERKEEALSAIEALKQSSEEFQYQPGIDLANQGMANFYIENGFPKEAEELYLEVLNRMIKEDAPLEKRLYILRQLYLRLPDIHKRLFYLQEAEKSVSYCKENGIEYLNIEHPVYLTEYFIELNYAKNYIQLARFEEAREHMDRTEEIVKKHDIYFAQSELPQLYLSYYMKRKDYKNAYYFIPQVEKDVRQQKIPSEIFSTLYNKAIIYKELGKINESVEIYEELLSLKDSINQTNFHKTLASVRTQYEVENLELEKKKMKEQAKQTRSRMTLLIGGCLLMFVIILVLGYMYRIVQQNRKELKRAKEKAEEADQLKSAFLANMNHEIRTPLNAIVGFSQVLIEEEDKDNRKEFAEIIQNNNELLQRLIADVLDISKIESNSMSLIYSEQDMYVMMKEIHNVLSLRIPPQVALILDKCEPFIFETDRNRLMQVLTNLLTNAMKHTQKGEIRFGYKLLPEFEIEFYVKDTGEGIPEDQLESIFNRFTQLENGKKGVGLGLAISKGLVTKMGGKIWATSVIGEGSVFHILLPQTKPKK